MSMQRLGARALVSLSLATSGLLAVAGARERWWPACPRGDYDTPRCLALQDDRYDYTAMREPWVPLGNAAELAGVSYAALALAVGLLPWLLLRSRTRLAWATSAVLGGTLIPLAAAQWASGRAGEVVASPLLVPVGLSWALLWPLVVLAVLCLPSRPGDPTALQQGARVLLATLLCLSSPFGQFLAAPVMVGYVSHDTAPWTEATTGLLLIAASLAAWPATARRRRTPTARRPRDDDRAVGAPFPRHMRGRRLRADRGGDPPPGRLLRAPVPGLSPESIGAVTSL